MGKLREISDMISEVEKKTEGYEKMLLLMALEWASGGVVSTSQTLEGWLEEQEGPMHA